MTIQIRKACLWGWLLLTLGAGCGGSKTATRVAQLASSCVRSEEYGHGLYREIHGTPDYRAEARVEDNCLWLAAMAAVIGIVASVVGLVVIRRSKGRVRGSYRLSIGIVFNLLAVLVVLFTFLVRGLLSGPNAV